MSWTLATSSGSVENLNVSDRHGLRPHSAQIRATVMCDTPPTWSASSRDDQCVTPSFSGGGSSVAARICSRLSCPIVGGAPDRGASSNASIPPCS